MDAATSAAKRAVLKVHAVVTFAAALQVVVLSRKKKKKNERKSNKSIGRLRKRDRNDFKEMRENAEKS